MRNKGSVEIARPIGEVFRLTSDHVAEWSTVVIEDEVLEEKPGGVGTTFRTVTEENGKRMEFKGGVSRGMTHFTPVPFEWPGISSTSKPNIRSRTCRGGLV